MPEIEEWVDRSQRTVRADKLTNASSYWVHRGRADDAAGGRAGEGTVAGRPPSYFRLWIAEPGLWLQFDWGWGPKVPGPGGGSERETLLFCAWLAWSRFRVVILTPTSANLREKHSSFAELCGACAIFCQQVNTRVHRETGRAPASALDGRTHPPAPLPVAPRTLNLDRAATFSGAVATSTARVPVQARARTAT
ncbi:hypothetical protein [Streptomyces sp. NBC_00286]|uniref:hypothetical protein n=1 Tax=Streptomyces sp. NBC_00286 TaxID=2975701 RepID=UPI003FA76854